MNTKIKFFFLLLLSYSASGQNIRTFEIKTSLFTLGELKVTQNINSQTHVNNYKLETTLNVLTFYKIEYNLESTYLNDTLLKSLIVIKVNGKNQHVCSTIKNSHIYNVKCNDDKPRTITQPITTGITPLYFNNYNGPDSVFSEYSGNFRPFIQKNDSTYLLDPEDPMEFVFSSGHIKKVIVHNPVMNFYIELKAELPK